MDTEGIGVYLTIPKYKFYRKATAKIDKVLFARLYPSVTETLECSRVSYKIAMLLTVAI